jgi:hypothetical protein
MEDLHATETPTVRLAEKGRVVRMFKVVGDNTSLEFAGLEHTPGATVRHPTNDILQVGSAQYRLHLGHKRRDSARGTEGTQWIRIFIKRKVAVEKERISDCFISWPSSLVCAIVKAHVSIIGSTLLIPCKWIHIV